MKSNPKAEAGAASRKSNPAPADALSSGAPMPPTDRTPLCETRDCPLPLDPAVIVSPFEDHAPNSEAESSPLPVKVGELFAIGPLATSGLSKSREKVGLGGNPVNTLICAFATEQSATKHPTRWKRGRMGTLLSWGT